MPKTQVDILWFFMDFVYPCAQPRTAEQLERESKRAISERTECEARIAQLPVDEAQLRIYLASSRDLLASESDRRSSVDSRLGTVIGLLSIAGSIVFGTIATSNPNEIHGWLKWPLVLGPLYLTSQVCISILASVRGLGRRSYKGSTPAEVLPAANERPETHLRGQIQSVLAMIENHRELNNQKVTELAIAHRATANFAGGLLVLAIVATVASLSARSHTDVIQQIRTDPAIRQLLRGPQGPPGSTGPAGPTGAVPKASPRDHIK